MQIGRRVLCEEIFLSRPSESPKNDTNKSGLAAFAASQLRLVQRLLEDSAVSCVIAMAERRQASKVCPAGATSVNSLSSARQLCPEGIPQKFKAQVYYLLPLPTTVTHKRISTTTTPFSALIVIGWMDGIQRGQCDCDVIRWRYLFMCV